MDLNTIPKIHRLGERYTFGVLTGGNISVEEKIDGSQFSFQYLDGVLQCRSKSTLLKEDAGMFKHAVETATRLASEGLAGNGWTYQCEFLSKPKHNVLKYDRVPAGYLVLFDIQYLDGSYASSEDKVSEAKRLGLEPVPVLHQGDVTMERIQALMNADSILGGTKIEGLVIKNYAKEHSERPGHPLTAKIVSDRFKEKMACRPMNPKAGPDDFVQALVNSLRTEARWLKAVQHLRESGKLVGQMKDMSGLVAEVQTDILAEESDWIKQKLFEHFSKDVLKGAVQGLAQWYQQKLADGWTVFEETHILNQKQNQNNEQENQIESSAVH